MSGLDEIEKQIMGSYGEYDRLMLHQNLETGGERQIIEVIIELCKEFLKIEGAKEHSYYDNAILGTQL
jgi:hypothetical protein